MNEKHYVQFISEVKASETTVDKAVDAIYNSNNVRRTKENKSWGMRSFGIAATAAVLCLVFILGFVFYPFSENDKNSFVISAGAQELNTYSLTELGELKCEFNSLGIGFDDNNQVTALTMCEYLSFPVSCSGENIEKITYTINGKGFFFLPDSATEISDKVFFENPPAPFPYEHSDYAECYREKVVSFSMNGQRQNPNLLLGLYIGDFDGGEYCQEYAVNYSDDFSYGKNFDYQQMYYELFNEDDYSVDVTATFADGSTSTKTMDLIIEKREESVGLEQKTCLIISAKLAEN